MKKFFKSFVSIFLAATTCISFVGCSAFGSGSNSDDGTSSIQSETSTYTIQYADDNGTHTIEVSSGEAYSLESIPERLGYTFLGLYDAEVGGTQYVNASGLSVSAYTDKTDITLYPQYQAKEYTVVLDYGEAAVTGSRQYTVAYGESLPTLPTNLTVSHKEFSGWYTEEDCGGTKVSDKYGLIPAVSIIDEENFEITNATKYIYLYAGFTTETYSVTLNYGSGITPETIEVEYGTDISDITPSTRNSDGYAVLSWGLSANGSEFTGIITENLSLYALEWAPVITFDSNGGSLVTDIVAKASTEIQLPTPNRDDYEFLYWATEDGQEYDNSIMPSESITLTANWKSLIVNKRIVVFDSNTEYTFKDGGGGNIDSNLTLDLSDVLSSDFEGEVTLSIHYKLRHDWSKELWFAINYYDKNTKYDEDYYLGCADCTINSQSYTKISKELECTLKGNMIYSCFHANSTSSSSYYYITDYYVDISCHL